MSGDGEMESRAACSRASSSPGFLRFSLGAAAIALAAAFRTILIAPFGWIHPSEFEYWFFIPDRDSGAVSVLVAGWLLWKRRRALAALRALHAGWTHWSLAALIVALYLWAIWFRAQPLLIPALCATLAVLASAWGGRAGLRLVAMPCVALLLAFPPPAPLLSEIIWALQGVAAHGAHFLLSLAGYSIQLEGTELHHGVHAFRIIEACSGWRGIQILVLVGLVAAELRGLPLRRALWISLAGIPLGIGLNIIRVCLVVLTQEEVKAEFFESHTPQGIAVLLVGSVFLYGLATLVEPKRFGSVDGAEDVPAEKGGAASRPPAFARWTILAVGLPATLAAISFAVPILRATPADARSAVPFFPDALPPWKGTPLALDYFFPYSRPTNPQFHMEYRGRDEAGREQVVDLFIAEEVPVASGLDRMPDAKLLIPANDWTIESREATRILQLGRDAERAIVSREAGSEHSYVIAWRVRDEGLLRESLRSLVGLQARCRAREGECSRLVVRMAAPILSDDDDGRARAETMLNDFISRFVLPLKVLEIR